MRPAIVADNGSKIREAGAEISIPEESLAQVIASTSAPACHRGASDTARARSSANSLIRITLRQRVGALAHLLAFFPML